MDLRLSIMGHKGVGAEDLAHLRLQMVNLFQMVLLLVLVRIIALHVGLLQLHQLSFQLLKLLGQAIELELRQNMVFFRMIFSIVKLFLERGRPAHLHVQMWVRIIGFLVVGEGLKIIIQR